mmetsp:Transcript_53694/g.165183  ORF Transcript_53694/g.165183 Transcript_53694/m.165183 type:complete len:225 (-) Transcript_53694:1043-1717(-)
MADKDRKACARAGGKSTAVTPIASARDAGRARDAAPAVPPIVERMPGVADTARRVRAALTAGDARTLGPTTLADDVVPPGAAPPSGVRHAKTAHSRRSKMYFLTSSGTFLVRSGSITCSGSSSSESYLSSASASFVGAVMRFVTAELPAAATRRLAAITVDGRGTTAPAGGIAGPGGGAPFSPGTGPAPLPSVAKCACVPGRGNTAKTWTLSSASNSRRFVSPM